MSKKESRGESNIIHSSNLKKYPLDSKLDLRKIFNFEYLTDDYTISHIKDHGRVMFIIRGLMYTKKTKLSDLLRETYPESKYFSMVKLLEKFDPKDDLSRLGPETVGALIVACKNHIEDACRSNQPTIIVQNSHMRKKEMMAFVTIAIQYDYIVIVASTMYKFYITPKAVARKDRLHISYLEARFKNWEDVPPLFTAWFISPNDSEYMRSITFEKLKALNKIKLFRSWFQTDDVTSYFQPRTNLSCLAGCSADADAMKKYYFSPYVQKAYGKCFPIFILGYLITRSDIIGLAQVMGNAKFLVMDDLITDNGNIASDTSSSILHYGKTTEFPQKAKLPPKSSGFKKEWMKGEKVSAVMCRPIHIAQKGIDIFSVKKISEQFKEGLQLMSDSDGNLNEKYFDSRLYKLSDDLWFTNLKEKFCFSTIFTGFYV